MRTLRRSPYDDHENSQKITLLAWCDDENSQKMKRSEPVSVPVLELGVCNSVA
jgi:hypothetical protein